MQQQDPLAQLRDIHLPEAISSWPPAPGWWVLALLSLVVIGLSVWAIQKRYQRNKYRRQALLVLEQLNSGDKSEDYTHYVQQLNALLKRTAIAATPNTNVAGLTGKQWLEMLDKSAKTNEFSEGIGSIFQDGPYCPHPKPVDTTALHQLAARWIKRHQFPC